MCLSYSCTIEPHGNADLFLLQRKYIYWCFSINVGANPSINMQYTKIETVSSRRNRKRFMDFKKYTVKFYIA